MKGVEPDGWFFLVPQSFSYGTGILFEGGNAGSTQGGASLALVGYGLIGNNVSPTVTIGGQVAKVTDATKYIEFNDSGQNAVYPFADMDELLVTVPPGSAGKADITVTSSAGTATLASGFNYVPVTDYASSDTFTNILYDPKRDWVYLSAGDHIDVFNAESNQFLTPIVPPSLGGTRQIMGLALTPDNSTLVAANFPDSSVAIIDPDNPGSSSAVQIPVTIASTPGVNTVVATSTGDVFVNGTSGTFGGCQLWDLNLSTLKATERTDPGASGFCGYVFSRDTLGGLAFGGGAVWSSATNTFTAGSAILNEDSSAQLSDSIAASGDGYWLASDFLRRLDAQMIQHTLKLRLPEFFTSFLLHPSRYPRGKDECFRERLLYTPVPLGDGNGGVKRNPDYRYESRPGSGIHSSLRAAF